MPGCGIRNAFVTLLLGLLFASGAFAQVPSENWRTLETPHFRVHFPQDFEEWAVQAAARLETSYIQLTPIVGFSPEGRVDVLVMDPVAQANGSAWPFLQRPRMVLWTTPPDPESGLGTFASWIDILAVHEQGHLMHLLRPSRNRVQQWLSVFIPLGPIGLRSPRWVSEGYATLLEGRLTGSGRPNGPFREAVLRIWAQSGRLPTYAQMSSDSESWMGMSMAYLAGSSFLEWLEQREGPESLRKVWSRLTARQSRSFDDAFAGVYREEPRALYDRFRAELTHQAIEAEKNRGATRDGTLWQDLKWATEPPQVSPDEKHLLTVMRDKDAPDRLVVFEIDEDESEVAKRAEKARRLQQLDPLDVPSADDRPLARDPAFEFHAPDGRRLLSPRWMPDGKSIVFSKNEPDAQGSLHPDVFRWFPREGLLERITKGAGVSDADPSSDGKSLIAVRNRFGKSQLVRIDASNGSIEEITAATTDKIYDYPRLSRDARSLAYLLHKGGSWSLVIRDLQTASESVLHRAPKGTLAQPGWSWDSRWIYASVGAEGYIEIHRFAADGSAHEVITRSSGASFAPALSPDDRRLYFLSLDPKGFDIRFMELEARGSRLESPPNTEPRGPGLEHLALSPEPQASSLEARASTQSSPYGKGRLEWSALASGNTSPGSRSVELGARAGDVLGRFSSFAVGSLAPEKGFSGAAVAGSWRGWPVAVSMHLFGAEERTEVDPENNINRAGVESTADWQRHIGSTTLDLTVGALLEHLEEGESRSFGRELAFISLRTGGMRTHAKWRFPWETDLVSYIGKTGSDPWSSHRVYLRGKAERNSLGIGVTWSAHVTNGAASRVDRIAVGGMPSTIVPESAMSEREFVPALDPGTLVGDEHEMQRIELSGLIPAALFYERHRVGGSGLDGEKWLELVGLDLNYVSKPLPLLSLPAFDFTAGVARLLSGPERDQWKWWLGLAWRP